MASCQNPASIYPVLRGYLAEFIKDFTVKDNNGWKSKALRMKYLYSETDTDDAPKDKAVAELLGVSSESVRNIKSIAVEFCDELASRQDAAYMTLKDIRHVEVKESLMRRFGFGHDEKTLGFYLDGMDYTILEQEGIGNFCIDTKYYGKGLKGVLKDVIPEVKNTLKSNPVPVLLDGVMDRLKAKKFDMLRLGFARDYLYADTDTYVIEDKDGSTYVSIKWDALPVTARQVRILYDFALQNGFDAFMKKDQLTREYNTRAYLYDGIDQISESQSVAKNEHIELGGNGTFRYCGKPTGKTGPVDLKAELLKYLAGHKGIAPFTDLRQFVDGNGWKYSDVTIKSYLSDDCVTAWPIGGGKKSFFILKTCWPAYANDYKNARGKGTTKPTKPTPPYKVAIINKAVGLLKAAPGNTLTKKALFEAVVDLYPGKSKNNVYKIFDESPLFEKTGVGKGASYTLAADENEN